MEFNYQMPVRIYFGADAVAQNPEAMITAGSRPFIITGRSSSKKNGSFHDVVTVLEKAGLSYLVFDEIEENPSLETVERAARIGISEGVTHVIGIGGGSPMDAAKAIAVFIKNPDITKETIFCGKQLEHIPVIEVATTSGTGSEVTPYSIVTVNAEKTKKNLGQKVYPIAAYLDPKYTFQLSRDITVNTAVDAFTHLVEGYLNVNSSPMSDLYAEKGFALFREVFAVLQEEGTELNAQFRSQVMLASMLAGLVISQTGTSLPHGMGYALTYHKGVPHGLANGILLPAYLRCFQDKEKLQQMLHLLGMDTLKPLEQIFQQLITLKIDISENEISEYAQAVYDNKAKLKNHPEAVSLDQLKSIYKERITNI